MRQLAATEDGEIRDVLLRAQRQLFWDERDNPPGIDEPRFLQRVMNIGNWQMVRAMEKTFPESYLVEVLKQASHGALSPKSWNFWCIRLGVNIPYPPRLPESL